MIDMRTAQKAHTAVAAAIKQGVLVRENCEVCGAEPAQAHHDDYLQPLAVRWLCRSHHRRHHATQKPMVDWRSGEYFIRSFAISPAEHERLKTVARQEERSVSAVIRLAIRRYIEEASK